MPNDERGRQTYLFVISHFSFDIPSSLVEHSAEFVILVIAPTLEQVTAMTHLPEIEPEQPDRRAVMAAGIAGLGWAALAQGKDAPVSPRSAMKITKVETF